MLKKILLIIVSVLALFIIGIFGYIQLNWDRTYDLPYPNLSASSDSSVIARGEYLVKGPAHCSNCHIGTYEEMIDSDKGETVALQGGMGFPLGPLGMLYTKNLTPDSETGIGRYSDGQLFRMMRHAVKPDGTSSVALIMPFYNMADDDLVAVVSYLRSLEPVKHEVPENQFTFLGKVIRTFGTAFDPVMNPTPPKTAPPMAATVERGEYLARYVANCQGCHTKFDWEKFEQVGPEYAGGMEFEPFPELHRILGQDEDLWARSVNLTPHPNSALSRFKTAEEWINRFRMGRLYPTSPMHWGPFSRMSDEDLEAIYLYLNSLDPVDNEVGSVLFKKTETQ